MADFDFVVPFRSRQMSRNWNAVCKVLEQTLASACNSRDRRFRVIVLCHELPDIAFDRSKCTFVQVDFDPPVAQTIDAPREERLFLQRADKARKLLLGLDRSRKDGARYCMILDADDLVSSRLVGYCLEADHPNGYVVEQGFRFDDQLRGWLLRRPELFAECGSCMVLRTTAAPFPAALDLTLDMTDYYYRRYTVAHGYVPEHMNRIGRPLEAVPFRATIYRFHPENCYADVYRENDTWLRRQAKKLLWGQRVTPALRNEFGLGEIFS